jgi:tetratricopeptide (TPR) repeat protein
VIAAQHLPYATYLERLRRMPTAEMLVAEDAGDYPAGLPAAVQLSLQAVLAADLGAACGAVMDLAAVLSPSGIRRELVHAAAAAGLAAQDGPLPPLTAEAADAVLARLAGASLLTFSVDGTTVTAHRLVMRVIRDSLAAVGALVGVCQSAAQLLEARAGSLWQRWHAERAAARDLAGHLLALAGSAGVCAPDTGLEFAVLGVRWWALGFLTELGDSAAQAIAVGEQLAADCERLLGPEHPNTLTSHGNLANVYRAAGRTAEAITLDEQVLAARERILAPDDPDILTSRNNLAEAYRAAGRTAEAITLHEQTLAARERVLGPYHPHTLGSRGNLASAYDEAGRTTEAIALDEQVLAARERVLGSDHPDTLQSRNNLAIGYRETGHTAEAIALHEQTLAARERVLGPDHPDSLISRNNLAIAYQDVGRAAEAITLLEQVLAARERILGPEHPHTLGSRHNLAVARQVASGANETANQAS